MIFSGIQGELSPEHILIPILWLRGSVVSPFHFLWLFFVHHWSARRSRDYRPVTRNRFYSSKPLLRLNIATGTYTALSSLSILCIFQLQPCGYLQYMLSTRLNTANCLSPELICDSIVNRSIQTWFTVYLSDDKHVPSTLIDTCGWEHAQFSTVFLLVGRCDFCYFPNKEIRQILCIHAHTQNQRIISP